MSASSPNTSLDLPEFPDGTGFEEFIAAYCQCSGKYVERALVQRETDEVLELDVLLTDFDLAPPSIILLEMKSGKHWGFPDIFKISGWMKYLNLNRAALIVKVPKDNQKYYARKSQVIGVSLIAVDNVADTAPALSALLGAPAYDPDDVEQWRYSYWAERNMHKLLKDRKKANRDVRRFEVMDQYLHAVNSGSFFAGSAPESAAAVYGAYKDNPNLSARVASELAGRAFDSATEIPPSIFRDTFYECRLNDVQLALYVEHRARLTVLKSAVDYLRHKMARNAQMSDSVGQWLGATPLDLLPETFLNGLQSISNDSHYHRYPVFWQWFLFCFGGFILTDRLQEEYELLSAKTGVPLDQVENALTVFDRLFPIQGGWFHDARPNACLRILKLFPSPFNGLGVNYRAHRYTSSGDLDDLQVGCEHTLTDLIQWLLSAVDLFGLYAH